MFRKAERSKSRLRMALIGPSGSGKTYTALRIARTLGDKIALIDTERGSAEKYAGGDEDSFVFDVCDMEQDFSPSRYIAAIKAAEQAGYDVLIIDSLSHAWSGKGGALEMVNDANARQKTNNKWAAWREVTPFHNLLVDSILQSPLHVICTMRTKTEWVIDDSDGKRAPKKVGLAPIQRDGIDYEFDVVADLDQSHNLIVEKTRCKALDGKVFKMAGEDVGGILKQWLDIGKVAPAKAEFKAPKGDPIPHKIVYYDEQNAPNEIRELISGKVLPWFASLSIPLDRVDLGMKFCATHFGVESVDQIPADQVDALAKYIREEVTPELKKGRK